MQREALVGRLALITGAASGIGYGMGETLAMRGMRIAVADIDAPAAEAARRDCARRAPRPWR